MDTATIFATTPALFITAVVLLSLLIGSFLNVVIHRLPIMLDRDWRAQSAELLKTPSLSENIPSGRYNIVVPRSGCPYCGAQINAWQNIPFLSYLLLKGKCASCRKRISARYPIVELSTAILSAAVAWKFGVTWFTAAALVLTWVLIALTVIDIDHQILPDDLTLSILWLGLLLSLGHTDASSVPVDPKSAIIGAIAGYLSLWCVYWLFKLVTGKEGMGYGDFKLFAALGAWLGWQMLPLIILLSAFTGAVVGITLIVVKGRDKNIPIPFGPYLAAAGWIALMWGPQIVHGYLGVIGVR